MISSVQAIQSTRSRMAEAESKANGSVMDFEIERTMLDEPRNEQDNMQQAKKSKCIGITCCVPGCYNNSKRDTKIWNTIPSNGKLSKIWLAKISRKNFKPKKKKIRVPPSTCYMLETNFFFALVPSTIRRYYMTRGEGGALS